jgi:hypothetical protein
MPLICSAANSRDVQIRGAPRALDTGMGKTKGRLTIRRETLRRLDDLSAEALAKVGGAYERYTANYTYGCTGMDDNTTRNAGVSANRYC